MSENCPTCGDGLVSATVDAQRAELARLREENKYLSRALGHAENQLEGYSDIDRLRQHNDALRAECKAERAAVTTRVVHGTPMLAMLVDDRIGDPKILTLHNARARVDELGALNGGTT